MATKPEALARQQIDAALEAAGWSVQDAKTASLGAARGVAIRPFAELPRLGECIRVTVGPWPMLEAFLEALPEVL